MVVNKLGECRASKVIEAANLWNRDLARAGAPAKAFVVQRASSVDLSKLGHLWVIPGSFPEVEGEPLILGTCNLGYYSGLSRLWGGVITFSDEHCLLRTAVHELGHALGLPHAPAKCLRCIMRAEVPRHEGHLVDFGELRREELMYVIRQMRPNRHL